jgi:hypothetical protein
MNTENKKQVPEKWASPAQKNCMVTATYLLKRLSDREFQIDAWVKGDKKYEQNLALSYDEVVNKLADCCFADRPFYIAQDAATTELINELWSLLDMMDEVRSLEQIDSPEWAEVMRIASILHGIFYEVLEGNMFYNQ